MENIIKKNIKYCKKQVVARSSVGVMLSYSPLELK